MNKKTIKTVAAAAVFAFGVSVIPAPAYAVPTNIVAATEGKNTLTLTEIQELAVIYNDTLDSLELSIKQLENQEMMTRNQKRDVENELDYLYYTDTGSDQLADMKEQIDGLKLLADANPTDMALQASYAALSGQYQSALASQKSAAQQLDNAFDQAINGINQLDDALDQMAEGKEDLQDAIEDLAHIMRYTSSQLALSIVQLTDSAALMEKQVALLDKSIAIYELQEKLGMATAINVDTQRTSKVEAENQLRDTLEQIDNLKRSLNQLIGRPANNELNVVPMKLVNVIDPAPKFTQELIDEFVEIDPDVVALLEERQDLKDSAKDAKYSDEKQDIEYQIQAKDLEIKKQRQAAEDDLKAMIATMNKNAVNYRVSMEKLATEQKNFEIAQKKYELGMISQLQLMQNELTLAQAELTNLSNGYQHYFDWQQFKLARQGIALTGANK
ncbi:MAG: hypothetical protein IJF50_09325 [Peptococcaceae bacterium]|nr:hypothetical protein [Peptococcaceae bacterium]